MVMYALHPNGWQLWISDGLAHANLVCAMWLVALAIKSLRLKRTLTPEAGAKLTGPINGCCAGAVLNAVLVAIHYRVWQGNL